MPNFEPEHNAPRLREYLGGVIFKTKTLTMKREYWEPYVKQLIEQPDGVEIDISKTPLDNIQFSCDVIGCIATRSDPNIFKVKVYRIDPNDDPMFNVDTYVLYNDFEAFKNYSRIVKYSSTSTDVNMSRFHETTVMLFHKEPDCDHWLQYQKLPKVIQENYKSLIRSL
ncbi:hypothetical protein JR338_06535 [Chloroflexota bacterium]|nr:hypothetical protein JR338_06535 [Chloroflexota bacterium]